MMEESPQVEVDREALAVTDVLNPLNSAGTAATLQAAVDATSDPDITEEINTAAVTPAAEERTTIPVELKGIDLVIEMSVPSSVAEKFSEIQSLLKRLREKFGDDTMLEELAQLVKGRVEKVTLSRAGEAVGQQVTTQQQQRPQGPQPVTVAQPSSDLGNYCIASTSCPWTGYALRNLDPKSIYAVLSDPQKRQMVTPQDLQMMDAFYRDWYAKETSKPAAPTQTSFANDQVPF